MSKIQIQIDTAQILPMDVLAKIQEICAKEGSDFHDKCAELFIKGCEDFIENGADTDLSAGDDVYFSPVIGREHSGEVHCITSINHEAGTATITGKSSIVAIESLSLVSKGEGAE